MSNDDTTAAKARLAANLMIAVATVTMSYLVTAAQTTVSRAVPRFTSVVDLTHALDEDTPYIPVPNITFPFKKLPIATVATNGVAAYRWEIHEHLGTQIDAPNHFFDRGLSLDQLPADSLVVPLVVIDVSARAATNPDTSLTVADIEAWERQHGRIADRAAVMMASGWESRIKDGKRLSTLTLPGRCIFRGSRRKPRRFSPVREKCPVLAWIRSRSIRGSMSRMPLTRRGSRAANGASNSSRTCGKCLLSGHSCSSGRPK